MGRGKYALPSDLSTKLGLKHSAKNWIKKMKYDFRYLKVIRFNFIQIQILSFHKFTKFSIVHFNNKIFSKILVLPGH
uniref:Uncharacterized protein n=1 Tax=Acidianus brierleyi TaxID=41673 RepID=A0A2U9IHV0_9CREN